MSYITEKQLSQYKFKQTSAEDFIVLKESISRDISKPMIFLSHKHDEYQILQEVISFLEYEGAEIYVDWMDSDMPAYTSSETAHKLKQKIEASDKFILIATESAIRSKWCNWELGLGDAEKYLNDIALLPVSRNEQDFSGSEYLRIYPSIEYQNGSSKYANGRFIPKGYYVLYPSNKYGLQTIYSLSKWLKMT